jgi:hypothetical protein
MFEFSHPYTMGLETADVIAITWQTARATYMPLGDVGAVGVTSKSTSTEKRPGTARYYQSHGCAQLGDINSHMAVSSWETLL